MDIREQITNIQTSFNKIQNAATTGSLMFIDLANSTSFKRSHPEANWLKRLWEFRESVKKGLGRYSPAKFMGDGILCFFSDNDVPATEVINIARHVLREIQETNRRYQYTAEYILKARVVLDYGKVYLFDQGDDRLNDPQGTCVDRLFRIEKFIPPGCIGFTNYFTQKASLQNTYSIGRYRLKGLGDERYNIHLLDEPLKTAQSMIYAQREISALADIWDLGRNGEGEVFIIGGYIPPDEGDEFSTVEMGDKDALVETITNYAKIGRIAEMVKNFARIGRVNDVRVLISSDISEEQLRENIVCIGGPYHNSCTLRMMMEIRSPYIFDLSKEETPLIDQIGHETNFASWEHGRVTRDYGFFARFTNPLNEDRHVILACGIETYGVHGAVRTFSGVKNNAHFLALHDGICQRMVKSGISADQLEFFCLLEFEIEINGQVRIPSLDMQLKRLVIKWGEEPNWSLQNGPPKG